MSASGVIGSAREAGMLRSGGSVRASVRSGYMPVPLEGVVLEGLARISVYLRKGKGEEEGAFTLYCTSTGRFTGKHREMLMGNGVRFIYISLQDQMRFRRQVEKQLEGAVGDPERALSAKAEQVYETSVELVNELMTEEGLGKKMPRLLSVSKAVTSLVMKNESAFSHLFAASEHDFYTATHMVNVGTWMVALAFAMGYRDMEELNQMCIAGMVHDIGKIYVAEEVLNKRGQLSREDWEQLRGHPASGEMHLKRFKNISNLVMRVTGEHHERMDGTGYPRGLKGGEIHMASRICGVVDSFDAMTAFRPFKERTETFEGALGILLSETPGKYDGEVVAAWVKLMRSAEKDGAMDGRKKKGGKEGRGCERYVIECPGRMFLKCGEGAGVEVMGRNYSESGLGFLSRERVEVSEEVRVVLEGKGDMKGRVVEGEVVHCRGYGDGWYSVGMRVGE